MKIPTPAIVLLIALTLPALAQAQYRATALAAGESITVDGRLDEPVWQRAAVHDRFQQQDPYTGLPAPHATRVRIAYDDRALYFAVHALDPDPTALRAPLVRYDKVFRDQDFVVVYVDGVGSGAAAQFFRVNAGGGVADGVHTAATDNEDFSPDFTWDAAARIVADGYVAELRIPLATLRFAHDGTAAWRVQVARRMPRENVYLFLGAPLTREAPSFIAAMLPLEDYPGPRSEASLQLRPTLTARATRETPDDPATKRRALDAGLDLKWRPRADWVLDATVNPDFSQVELDVPQLQRTRQFALFLQEKRPFFLEGSDLLQTPTDSLYSRAIADPRWGARATYRGDRLAATVLGAADRGGGLVLLPGPYATGAAPQPAAAATSARLRWDGPGKSLGAVASDRSYRDGRGYNRVAGPDFIWQLTSEQFVRGQWLGARTTAVPDADGRLHEADERAGHFANLEWFRNSALMAMNLRYREASRDFRNDNGFLAQNGFRQWRGSINRQFRPAARPAGLHEITPFVDVLHADDIDLGHSIATEVHPGLYLGGPRGSEINLQYRPAERTRLAPGGRLHAYRQWYLFATATPSPLLTLLTLEATAGEQVDVLFDRVRPGTRFSLSGRIRIGNRFEIEPRIDQARLQADGGGRAQSETAAQWLSVLHLTARDSLRLILQRTAFTLSAAGAAPVEDRAWTGSLVYAHRRSSATVLYVGAARSRDRTLAGSAAASEAFIKAQWEL